MPTVSLNSTKCIQRLVSYCSQSQRGMVATNIANAERNEKMFDMWLAMRSFEATKRKLFRHRVDRRPAYQLHYFSALSMD